MDETVDLLTEEPGVYLLARASHAGSLKPHPIRRLLQADPHGLLDIGEAANLRRRLGQLRECVAQPGTLGHMAGWRLGHLGLLRKLGCESEDLLVSHFVVKTKEDAYGWEGWLLRTYFELFGELPPLNYKFNWSAFVEQEL